MNEEFRPKFPLNCRDRDEQGLVEGGGDSIRLGKTYEGRSIRLSLRVEPKG